MADTNNRKINIWINGQQVTNSVKDIRNSMRKLVAEQSKMTIGTKEYIEAGKKIKQLKGVLDNHNKTLGRVATGWQRVKQNIKAVAAGTLIAGGLSGAIQKLGQVAKNAVNIFKNFGKASSKLQSILGITKDEMKPLTDQAKQLGSTSAFTASQVLELQTELAKLGFTTDEIQAMTESTLNAAAAMGSELGEQAALTGAVIRSFNKDASEATKVNDILATATTKTALDFQKLQTALPIVSATANNAGVDLERLTALLGTLADRGIDASTSATSLRNIFLKLAKDGKTWDEAMNEINESTNKNATAMKLFDVRASTAANILAVTSNEAAEGKIKFDELEEALRNSDGAAKDLADTMLDNLAGDMTKAQSAWEGFILSLEEGDGVISRVMRNVTQLFTGFLQQLTNINEGNFKLSENLQNIAGWSEKVAAAIKKQDEALSAITDKEKRRNKATGLFMKQKAMLAEAEKRALGASIDGDKRKAAAYQLNIERLQALIENTKKYLPELKKVNKENGGTGSTDGETEIDEEALEKQKRAAEKRRRELEKRYNEQLKAFENFQNKLKDFQNRFLLDGLDKQAGEREALKQHWDEILEIQLNSIGALEDLGNKRTAKETKLLEKLKTQRIFLIEQRQNEELVLEKKHAKETQDARLEVENKISEALAEHDQKMLDRKLTDKDREVAATFEHFQSLIKLAEENGLETVQLYEAMKEAMAAIDEDFAGDEGNKDPIFGMGDEEWDKLKKQIGEIIELAAAVGNAWGAYNDIKKQQDEAELARIDELHDRRKTTLDAQLQSGLISEKKYNQEVAKLDSETDSKKKKIQREQAKREKNKNIFDSIINTASAVTQALPNFILAALVGAAGLAKTAVIASQPLPKLAKGGRINSPMVAEIGEEGPEIVFSNQMITNPTTGPILNQLADIQEGKRPHPGSFARPDFDNINGVIGRSKVASQTGTPVTDSGQSATQVNEMISESRMLNEKMDMMLKVWTDPKTRLKTTMVNDEFKTFNEDEAIGQALADI